MADRYWVGGTGSWSATNTANWSASSGGASGASVPTSADNVFFDNASDSGADYTVTITHDPAASCANLTISSQDFILTLASTNVRLNIHGSININPVVSGRYNATNTHEWSLNGTGAQTISLSNAAKLSNGTLVFNSSGTYTLSTGVTTGGSVTVQNPSTLALAGFTLTIASDFTLNSGGTISFGTGGVIYSTASNITHTFNGTVTAGTGHVWMNGAGTQTLNGGGKTFYQVTMGSVSATSLVVNGANTYTNLIFASPANVSRTVTVSANQTVTSALNFGGASPTSNPHDRRTVIKSNTFGTQRTISIATAQNVQTLDFEDIAITGAASPISGSSLSNRLGNSGITFTAAKTSYWVGGTGNWSSDAGTKWAASSGGAAAVTNYPLAQDTVVVDNSSGTGTITVDTLNFPQAVGTLDLSARSSGALTFSAGSSAFYIYKDWKLSFVMAFGGTSSVHLLNRSSGSIDSNGASVDTNVTINAIGGTVSLLDAFSQTSSYSVSLTTGTLDLNGSNFTCGSFSAAGSSSRTLALGSNNLVCAGSGASAFSASGSGFSVTGTGKIRMTSASAKTFAGNGLTYPELENGGAGSLTISGNNTFTTISNSVQPTTFNFTSGTTQTVTNFNVSGTAGNLVTITATSTGQATLSKASGTVSVSYTSISKSNATGGATWRALAADGNVNGGTNTGWIFSSGNGLFFGSNF